MESIRTTRDFCISVVVSIHLIYAYFPLVHCYLAWRTAGRAGPLTTRPRGTNYAAMPFIIEQIQAASRWNSPEGRMLRFRSSVGKRVPEPDRRPARLLAQPKGQPHWRSARMC